MHPVRFYFDYLSPYAYLAWRELGDRRAQVEPVPVLFSALLDAHGQLGPAEIPSKRRFVIRDCLRLASALEVGFTFPGRHPFRSIEALRLSLVEVSGAEQHRVIDALWRAGWEQGGDLSGRDVLVSALEDAGLDGTRLLSQADSDLAKQSLRRHTEQAIGDGVFGVPSFGVGGQLLWGRDQISTAFAVASGSDPVDAALVSAVEAAPPGLARRRPGAADADGSTGQGAGDASWDALAEAMRAFHPQATPHQDGLRFVLAVGPKQTRVGMELRPFVSYGVPSAQLRADLGIAGQVDPWDALSFNGTLSFGALTIDDGVLMLHAVVLLAEHDPEAVETLVHRLAGEAAEIKQRLQLGTPSGDEFSHYGE